MDFSSPTLDETRRRLLARFGERVDPWWQGLPAVLADLAERWELVVGEAVGRGNTSLVVRCRLTGGNPAILKLTPDAEFGAAEATALRSWEASGRVPLVLGHHATSGALLLEAIANESPLSELGTGAGLDDVANLIADLHAGGAPVVADGVVPLGDRVESLFQRWLGEGTAPADQVRRGHELARQLAADVHAPVMLHGDLHPGNVLEGGAVRGLVAIDPRPCVGDPAFDAVDWAFWNVDDPRDWQPRSRELARALEVEPDRLWAWCSAFAAVLATGEAARGASPERIAALLTLAP